MATRQSATSQFNDPTEVNVKVVLKYVGYAFLALFLLITFFKSFYTVQAGHRGIEITYGRVTGVAGDGFHLKMPYVTSVKMADIRVQKSDASCVAGSKDLQRVSTTVSLNYVLDPNKIQEIYTTTGLNVSDLIIEPRIQEIVKAVTAKYSAEELVTRRDMVKNDITLMLKEENVKYHVLIAEVQITDFRFSESFDASIEAKQQAEQAALKAKNDLDRIRVEAEQKIAMANAEAEAIRIQANAIRAQGGKEYVALKAIEQWNGKLPEYMGGNGPVPFLDVSK